MARPSCAASDRPPSPGRGCLRGSPGRGRLPPLHLRPAYLRRHLTTAGRVLHAAGLLRPAVAQWPLAELPLDCEEASWRPPARWGSRPGSSRPAAPVRSQPSNDGYFQSGLPSSRWSRLLASLKSRAATARRSLFHRRAAGSACLTAPPPTTGSPQASRATRRCRPAALKEPLVQHGPLSRTPAPETRL